MQAGGSWAGDRWAEGRNRVMMRVERVQKEERCMGDGVVSRKLGKLWDEVAFWR